MMPKRDKRTFRQQAEAYWNEYWKDYPYYEHTRVSISFNGYSDKPRERKLKKSQFYPKEYAMMSGCPSAWNTMFHIRPCRRQSKKMTEASYVRGSRITNIVDQGYWAYMAEERYYPAYKMHVYYY